MDESRREKFPAALRGGVALTSLLILVVGFVAILRSGVASSLSATPIPECSGARSLDVGCYVDRYEALTRTRGAEAALGDLAQQRAKSGYVASACHQLTHVVGRTAGEITGPAALTQGSELCASGYYHGVVETIMMRIGPEQVFHRAETVCADLRQRQPNSFLHYNCVHGMGHGFMATLESDVFRSLSGCDALTDSWERQHCYSGVFMENLTAITHLTRPSKDLRSNDPLYPCTEVDARYKSECYLKQTAYALYVRNDDFDAVFRLCRERADAGFHDVCYQGVGGDAAIMSSKYVIGEGNQAATIHQLCLLGPDDEARSHCIVGAVTSIVRDLAGDDVQARALCSAVHDPTLATVCETTREDAGQRGASPAGAHHHHHS